MKNVKTFDQFVNESGKVNEERASGLEFAADLALEDTKRFKPSNGYSDKDPSPLFSFFPYSSSYSAPGLPIFYFENTVPADKFKAVAASASSYLTSGKKPDALIEMLAAIYIDHAPGGRSSEKDTTKAAERVALSFTPENKDNQFMMDHVTNLINVLKSWTSGAKAARLNLAVAVNKVCSYSAYMGSDFEEVYNMIAPNLRKKNMPTLKANSKIEINKDNTNISSSSDYMNGGEFVQIDRNEWESAVTMKVDGKDYIVGSFSNSSAYGRY